MQVKLTFGRFLQDAALFYRQLACKLQVAYGNVGFSLADAQLEALPAVPNQQYSAQDCQASVYRCLICLGDIFRFASSSVQKNVDLSTCLRKEYCGWMAWPSILLNAHGFSTKIHVKGYACASHSNSLSL